MPRAAPEPFKVYRENWPALALWHALWPRWRLVVGPRGVLRQALDLAQVQAAIALSGTPRRERARLYEDLLVMEAEALELINEQ